MSLPSWLPKNLRSRVESCSAENGLCDDCEYMVLLKKPWVFCESECSVWPCKDRAEVLRAIRSAVQAPEDKWE